MRSNKLIATAALAAAGLALTSQAALAYQAGDIYVRAGIEKADISADELSRENNFNLAGGYLLHDKLGLEVGIGEAVDHDFALDSGAQGSLDRMPVTLLMNYYPLGGIEASRIQPFLGVGVNYTRFSSVDTDGADSLDIDDDYGVVGQVGMDMLITERIHATGYARYSEIDADFERNGSTVDEVRLDPLTVGAGITYRF
jgi:outer membrane protein